MSCPGKKKKLSSRVFLLSYLFFVFFLPVFLALLSKVLSLLPLELECFSIYIFVSVFVLAAFVLCFDCVTLAIPVFVSVVIGSAIYHPWHILVFSVAGFVSFGLLFFFFLREQEKCIN